MNRATKPVRGSVGRLTLRRLEPLADHTIARTIALQLERERSLDIFSEKYSRAPWWVILATV